MTRIRRKAALIVARMWSDARAPSMRQPEFWSPTTDLIVNEIRATLVSALQADHPEAAEIVTRILR